jgi:hypothetical protein
MDEKSQENGGWGEITALARVAFAVLGPNLLEFSLTTQPYKQKT